MAVTDPIADYLTRIRNAQQAGHRVVEIPSSVIITPGELSTFKFSFPNTPSRSKL